MPPGCQVIWTTHGGLRRTKQDINMHLSAQIKTPSVTYEQPLGLDIDGKWTEGTEHEVFETGNPTNETIINAVHEVGAEGGILAFCSYRSSKRLD